MAIPFPVRAGRVVRRCKASYPTSREALQALQFRVGPGRARPLGRSMIALGRPPRPRVLLSAARDGSGGGPLKNALSQQKRMPLTATANFVGADRMRSVVEGERDLRIGFRRSRHESDTDTCLGRPLRSRLSLPAMCAPRLRRLATWKAGEEFAEGLAFGRREKLGRFRQRPRDRAAAVSQSSGPITAAGSSGSGSSLTSPASARHSRHQVGCFRSHRSRR